tara:strand:- start:135 stop:617 length:483 start_codon:yes stop_codon:yes gene_type:complete
MKKIFFILSLTLFSCYSNYHLPYINYSETKALQIGMSMIQVQEILGEPLYVHSIGKAKNQIEHAYSVRTLALESKQNGILDKLKFYKGYDIQADNPLNTYRITNKTRTSNELHKLIIVYENNVLVEIYTVETVNQKIRYLDYSTTVPVLLAALFSLLFLI